jgi:hypothetical protein
MSGELTKMVIKSYQDEARDQHVEDFTLQFNPSTFSRAFEIEFEQESGSGNTTGSAQFKRYKSQDYTVDFVLDGTGVSGGEKVDVSTTVTDFLRITGEMDGEIHRPRFLLLVWCGLTLRCVLKSATINYTLFEPGGNPLRAKVTAVFSESVEEELRAAREGKESADLTRVHEALQGETLPNLAYRFYGDPAKYEALARFNQLDDFRAVRPGQAVRFPPSPQIEALEVENA